MKHQHAAREAQRAAAPVSPRRSPASERRNPASEPTERPAGREDAHGSVPGAVELDPYGEEIIAEARARASRPLRGRDLRASVVIGGAFLATALAMAVLVPSDRSPSLLTLALYVAAYAIAARVEFEIGTGVAVPTQLVLVPMLFVLPLGAVPLAVAAAFVVRDLPDYASGRVHPERALLRLVNSWHAVGPALVLAYFGEAGPAWDDWPVYLAALAAQFALDFASSTTRDWLALGFSPISEFRFMAWVYLVDLGLAPVGLGVAILAGEQPLAVLVTMPLVGLLAIFARERKARVDHALELRQAYRGAAFLLGDIVERDNAYTGKHSRDVVTLALKVGDALGIDARERREAELAALLHDVGKIRVPGEIINKPGPLTTTERAILDRHTIDGENMLGQIGGSFRRVAHLVRCSHEHFDGSGYPDGLIGPEIPLAARIVSCCDAFSAMTSDRPYRPALSTAAALDELRTNSGTQFDPVVVEALAAVVEHSS